MRILCYALAAAALTIGIPSAHADIYTWIDKKGLTNVSNLPPPEGARVTNVERTPPKDAAREAAAREATRQAEVRALNDRVQQLTDQVEQQRREPVAFAYAPPPMPYAPPAPAYVVNVMQPAAPSYAGASGCDYAWGDCGYGAWPGYYGSTVILARGRNFRHAGIGNPGNNQIVPPLLPLPSPPRMQPTPQPPRHR